MLVSAGETTSVLFWDVGEAKLTTATIGGDHIASSANGRMVVSGSSDFGQSGLVNFWDPGTGKERSKLRWEDGKGGVVALSPDGKILAGKVGNSIKLWDLTGK